MSVLLHVLFILLPFIIGLFQTVMPYLVPKGKGTGGGVGKGKKGGKLGKGGVGPGGWPDGMQNGVVRFIRLEYAGEGWDDGMDPIENADVNFLNEIHEITGFKVAEKGESHP